MNHRQHVLYSVPQWPYCLTEWPKRKPEMCIVWNNSVRVYVNCFVSQCLTLTQCKQWLLWNNYGVIKIYQTDEPAEAVVNKNVGCRLGWIVGEKLETGMSPCLIKTFTCTAVMCPHLLYILGLQPIYYSGPSVLFARVNSSALHLNFGIHAMCTNDGTRNNNRVFSSCFVTLVAYMQSLWALWSAACLPFYENAAVDFAES